MIFFSKENYFLKFMKLSFFIGVMQGILHQEWEQGDEEERLGEQDDQTSEDQAEVAEADLEDGPALSDTIDLTDSPRPNRCANMQCCLITRPPKPAWLGGHFAPNTSLSLAVSAISPAEWLLNSFNCS